MKNFKLLVKFLKKNFFNYRLYLGLFLIALGLNKKITSKYGHNVLILNLSSISFNNWLNPDSRSSELKIFQYLVHDGDICIDIGANIGTITTELSRLTFPNGFVIAFEPSFRTFLNLTANVQKNIRSNVVLINQGLGKKQGLSYLSTSLRDDCNHITTNGVPIKMSALDKFTVNFIKIRLIKIDVEGAEYDVLCGAEKTISKSDIVIFELNSRNLQRYSINPEKILHFFKSRNFSIYAIDEKNDVLFSSLRYSGAANYIAFSNILKIKDKVIPFSNLRKI